MPKQKVPAPKVPAPKVPAPKVLKVPVPVPPVPVPPVPVPPVSVPVPVPVPPVSVPVPPVPVPPVPTMIFYRPPKTTAKGAHPEVHIVYTHAEIAAYMGIPADIFSGMPENIRVANMEKYHTSLQAPKGGRHPLFWALKKYIPIGTPVTPVSFAAALEKVRTEIISLAKNENLRTKLMAGITESRESDRKSNKKTKKTDE